MITKNVADSFAANGLISIHITTHYKMAYHADHGNIHVTHHDHGTENAEHQIKINMLMFRCSWTVAEKEKSEWFYITKQGGGIVLPE